MTRREKFSEMMLDMAIKKGIFAVNNGRPCLCDDIGCNQCEFYSCADCTDQLIEWLNAEYIEPPVDWSKVQIDTPILVRDSEEEKWKKRHFAGINKDGSVMAWEYGGTSWSSDGPLPWNFAKLATPGKIVL